MPTDAEKKARLAEALRANLRRRKVRARAGEAIVSEKGALPPSEQDDKAG